VRVIEDGPVLRLVLEDPATRNALTLASVRRIADVLSGVGADPEVRLVRLSGAAGTFCSGWNRHDGEAADPAAGRRALGRAYLAIAGCPVPVLAEVRGSALGAAVGLVAASDLAISALEAVFGLPEARFGLVANPAMVPCLDRLRPADAARFLLTGQRFTGVEAAEAGLVGAAVPEADLDRAVHEMVAGVLAATPDAVAATKRLLRELAVPRLRDRLELAASLAG
jgi:enoyl-CoA hydratase/carnithine racemase